MSSSQQCYLNSRHTVVEYNVVTQELIKMQIFFFLKMHTCAVVASESAAESPTSLQS